MASESWAERQVCFLLAVWSREQSPELKPQKLGFNSHSMACTTQPLVTEANTYALSQIGAITGVVLTADSSSSLLSLRVCHPECPRNSG